MLALIGYIALLIVANGTPVLLSRLLGPHGARPIDGGHTAPDGRPWLGTSKTWRGLVGAIVATMIVSPLVGVGLWFAAAFGALAMLGDLISSFSKRRLGLESSAKATGLDQIPEAALPMLFAYLYADIDGWIALSVVLVFVGVGMGISPLLFRLGIRRQPH